VKAHKTSGGRKMPVRHTIPLGIVIFLVLSVFVSGLTEFLVEYRWSECVTSDLGYVW